ncbi:MAG: cytochrome c biogenesis protein CcsA [Phycisphaerales bacterium]|nr:cytochrome c biogenesis protein CcsA [Phycisphaerales bacterium]
MNSAGKALGQWLLGAAIVTAVAALAVAMLLRSSRPGGGGFAAEIDLAPLDRSAVHTDGRIKSFDSFAADTLSHIAGPRRVGGLPKDFTYLDMLLRPERYDDADAVYVKNRTMRADIAEALRASVLAGELEGVTKDRLAAFEKQGLISRRLLMRPEVTPLMNRWAGDLIRTAKFVDQIEGALATMRPESLAADLRIVPPPPGSPPNVPWISVRELAEGAPAKVAPAAALRSASPIDRLDAAVRERLASDWARFATAWQAENAAEANAALASFAAALPAVNAEAYPNQSRLGLESQYFKLGSLTWVWLCYLLSVVFLLMSVAFRWDAARRIGMGAFTASFLLHTASLGLRWYVSGRWPNANMFEAVTTSVWFGAVLAIVIEALARRSPMRNLFALGAAAASMAALMSAHFLPQLDSNIRNVMPVLNDLWLYIHTNVIIASYALIAMAAVTAGLYLVWRLLGGGPDHARGGGGTEMLLDAALTDARMASDPASARRVSAGAVFDGATLVMMQLSFVMLWAGIVMGAIWADHSWGRPWGWDPKEVFALNTFIVYIVLIHVRLRAKDKGLWTAWLAVIGCGVMLFNWIVINFVIAGLHSYA